MCDKVYLSFSISGAFFHTAQLDRVGEIMRRVKWDVHTLFCLVILVLSQD